MSHNLHSDGHRRLHMGVYETDGYRSQPPTPRYVPGILRRSRLILPKVTPSDQTSTPAPTPKRPRLDLPDDHQHLSSSGSEGGEILKQPVQAVPHVAEYRRQSETQHVRSTNTPINNGIQILSTVNPMQAQCPKCRHHYSERNHLQQLVVTLRKNVYLLTEEKGRLHLEAKRERDDLLAALMKNHVDSEALLTDELDDERAKSRDLAAELKSTKQKLEASRSNAMDRGEKNRQQLDEQRAQFERDLTDVKIELRTAKENSTRLEQQLKETIDEKLMAEMELIEIKTEQELERRNRDSLATRIEELQASLNSANRQLEQKEIERRQVQQQYTDVLDKCERQRSRIENLRKSNMKLCKTNDDLRRMKEDADLRVLNLDEINQRHIEKNVLMQTRIRTLESQQKSQRNYKNICTRLLHLMDKYQKNIGQFVQRHGDPPEIREKLKACLERIMEGFVLEAARVHNSEF